jgi:Outer membrane lipoprotein carrier protein LolA-like
MRAALLLLTVLLIADIAPAADAPGFESLMAELARHPHRRASFIEQRSSALLDHPVTARGELRFDAPDRLEMTTSSPRHETLLLEHGVATLTRGDRRFALALSDHPELVPLLDSIRATLAGDRVALEANFTPAFEARDDRWTLALTPRGERAAALVKVVRIEGDAAVVQRVTVERTNGDRSQMDVQEEAGT